MCGILGCYVSSYDYRTLELIELIMKELMIRGHHSTGLTFFQPDTIKPCFATFKTTNYKSGIDEFSDLIQRHEPKRFIFHNRYSTSGDWHNMENNPPIVVESVGAIAMNGVLSMKTKAEMESDFDVKLKSENDAEVFLRKMEQSVDVLDFLKSQERCSYAGIILTQNKMVGLRNNKRPMYLFKAGFMIGLTSTYDTLQRAGVPKANIQMVRPLDKVEI